MSRSPAPWTVLLESIHSSLIDELVDRSPKIRPELGMPSRESDFSFPDDSVLSLLTCPTWISGMTYFIFIGMDLQLMKTLNLTEKSLWDALLARSRAEFLKRGIQPRIETASILTRASQIPSELNSLVRTVWIPLRVGEGRCFLGLGM